MLTDAPFGHDLIRKYVIAFGTLFNNIRIDRANAPGAAADIVGVPLRYSPKQSYRSRLLGDPDLENQVRLNVPAMCFDMGSMNYASERKLNTINRIAAPGTSNSTLYYTYTPVPYDLSFSLHIFVNNIRDGSSVLEQILPYFTPELTVSLKPDAKVNISQDIPIVLNAVNVEDNFEEGFEATRMIIWSLDFTLRGSFFGPVNETGIISKVFINLHPDTNTALANNYEQVYAQPGFTSGGVSTSNVDASVLANTIAANSDWGFATNIYTFLDYE
jgi:hypothetical protein